MFLYHIDFTQNACMEYFKWFIFLKIRREILKAEGLYFIYLAN